MALDGPYTLDDLLAMTSGKRKSAKKASPLIVKTPPATAAGNTRPLRLIGIDPGTRFVGWGVIESLPNNTLRMVECGCATPPLKWALKDRLKIIFSELEEVLSRTRPDAAALEETFAGVNMKSAIAMGEGRGVALLCLARANLDVLEISPRSIKRAVTGSGGAGKTQVARLVCSQLGLKEVPHPEDITDALAAAIALARHIGTPTR